MAKKTRSGSRRPPATSDETNSSGSTGGTAVSGEVQEADGESGGNGERKVITVIGRAFSPEVQRAILTTFEKMDGVRDKRSAQNADMKALREALVARGLNKEALKMAEKFRRMDEGQREGFDLTWEACRRAIGLPVQRALPLGDPDDGDDDGAERAEGAEDAKAAAVSEEPAAEAAEASPVH